jgi:hypothetical protein
VEAGVDSLELHRTSRTGQGAIRVATQALNRAALDWALRWFPLTNFMWDNYFFGLLICRIYRRLGAKCS